MEVLFTIIVHDWGNINLVILLRVLTILERDRVIVYYIWAAKAPLLTMPALRKNGITARVSLCTLDTVAWAVPSQISGIAKAAFTNPCSRLSLKFKNIRLIF
jgi:hypothetical protein